MSDINLTETVQRLKDHECYIGSLEHSIKGLNERLDGFVVALSDQAQTIDSLTKTNLRILADLRSIESFREQLLNWLKLSRTL